MKKNLEDWLRGNVPYPSSGAVPSPNVLNRRLPVAPLRFREPPVLPEPTPAPATPPKAVREETPVSSSPSFDPPDPLFFDFLRSPAEEKTDVEKAEPDGPRAGEERTVFTEFSDVSPEAPGHEDRGFSFPSAPAQAGPSAAGDGVSSEEDGLPEKDDEHRYDHDDHGEKTDIYADELLFHKPVQTPESPEREAALFTEQLRRLEQMRRNSTAFGRRPGFRGDRGRLFTLLLLLILIAGTAFALWRHMQRNSFDSLMTAAEEEYRQEGYEAALDIYGRTARRYPARIEPLVGMARSAERLGRIDEAIDAWNTGMALIPIDAATTRAGAFYETGRLYSILKAWDRAQENFEKAVELDGTNYNAFFALGNALEEQDRPEKALSAYKRALDLSPSADAAAGAVKRVSALLAAEQQAAVSDRTQKYEQAIQVGNVALGLKRYDEASERFAEALAIRSDDAAPWAGFAAARQGLGDTAGAIRYFRGALERDPENVDLRTKLEALQEGVRKEAPKKPSPPRKQPRKKPAARSPIPSAPAARHASVPTAESLSRRRFFDEGISRYDEGAFGDAFLAFLACLRSSARDPLPPAPLAGEIGPLWKGLPLSLRVPADMMRLSEAICLNPDDRDLYLNLLLSGTKIETGPKTPRAPTINDIFLHARTQR